MMHLAERKKDPVMAATAPQQIETALAVTHAGGHTPNAAYYEARLVEARGAPRSAACALSREARIACAKAAVL
jgi:hypothetical protein